MHAENSRARYSEEETDEDEELALVGKKSKSKLCPVCYSLVHSHLQQCLSDCIYYTYRLQFAPTVCNVINLIHTSQP